MTARRIAGESGESGESGATGVTTRRLWRSASIATRRWAGTAALTGLFVVAATSIAGAQTSAVERGKAKFDHTCAPCHAAGPGDDGRAMLPGTDALRIKYRGELPPLLEQRTDLTAVAIRTFVRTGTWSMPPFRKTEVTDAELEDIAAYIAESSKRAAAARR
jgi:mono/diheme cytochrome c family protein